MYIETLHLQPVSTIGIFKLYFLHYKKFPSHEDMVSFEGALEDVKTCMLFIFLKLLCIIYSHILPSKN